MQKIFIALIIIAAAVFIIGLYCPLVARRYTIKSNKISTPIKIALITDLHSSLFGESQRDIAAIVDEYSPDFVMYGGDICDDRRDFDACGQLFSALSKYQSFYVTGNHEMYDRDIEDVLRKIDFYGVKIMRDERVDINIKGQRLTIAGLSDPIRLSDYGEYRALLDHVKPTDENRFSILLAHRPEFAKLYAENGFDLSLCGHAHGGQWRLPYIINGLYAPHQGLFPKYAGGEYKLGDNHVIVSRGLSKLNPLPRIYNPHEVVLVDILPERQ